MNKIFVSGPVTGKQDYEVFFEKAKQQIVSSLRDKDVLVVVPSLFIPNGFDYEAYVRMGIAVLAECDTICLLPGWEDSTGALAEYRVAKALNKEILFFADLQ